MNSTEIPLRRKQFLEMQAVCQPTSRYLKFLDIKEKKPNSKESIKDSFMSTCPFCGNDYTPNNRKVRLRSKVKGSRKILKWLEVYQTDPKILGKFQYNKVQAYLNSYNKFVVTCNVCKKTLKIPCQKRPIRKPRYTDEKESLVIEDLGQSSKKKKKKKKKENQARSGQNESEVDSKQPPEEGSSQHKKRTTDFVGLSGKGREDRVQGLYGVMEIQRGARIGASNEQKTKATKKMKSRQMNQQLSKMLAKEKQEKKSASLSDFLSNL